MTAEASTLAAEASTLSVEASTLSAEASTLAAEASTLAADASSLSAAATSATSLLTTAASTNSTIQITFPDQREATTESFATSSFTTTGALSIFTTDGRTTTSTTPVISTSVTIVPVSGKSVSGGIIGGVIATVVVLVAIILILYRLHRRKKASVEGKMSELGSDYPPKPEPFLVTLPRPLNSTATRPSRISSVALSADLSSNPAVLGSTHQSASIVAATAGEDTDFDDEKPADLTILATVESVNVHQVLETKVLGGAACEASGLKLESSPSESRSSEPTPSKSTPSETSPVPSSFNPTTPTIPPSSSVDGGLSKASIRGIVTVVIAAVAVMVGAIVFYHINRRKKAKASELGSGYSPNPERPEPSLLAARLPRTATDGSIAVRHSRDLSMNLSSSGAIFESAVQSASLVLATGESHGVELH
ncbi:hypothetical protein BDP27DRAFT_1442163 [Rhodocollybia butyracea]|uniref:Uncharacterized protein n=1 Tax=Rhodocollybia butyracea TaxID=206335 RepID=A0A9P5Q8E7_9AGAR|nr:hypothetical protein BDP27DRAFT_1442163 [Rhodocollybia butyracea]